MTASRLPWLVRMIPFAIAATGLMLVILSQTVFKGESLLHWGGTLLVIAAISLVPMYWGDSYLINKCKAVAIDDMPLAQTSPEEMKAKMDAFIAQKERERSDAIVAP